jgi:predicted amidophosphoribosyltransferase
LAKSIAKNLEIEYINLLRSNSQKAQKEMNYKERFKNIDYKLINDKTSLKGKSVIIVDDIVTTGSSMSSAAMLIRSLGAKRVLGATLGIAYRDDKLILDTSDRFIK